MNNEDWTKIIESRSGILDLKISQLWAYRDLIWMFVRRDIVVVYKQTILGPLWYVIQPLFSSVIFTIVFDKIAKISTEGVPAYLFYLAGLTCWGYFSTCLTATSDTFSANQGIFGKVYFPRMAVPVSVVISNSIKFLIQFALFLCFYFYYRYRFGDFNYNLYILLIPFLFILMAGLSLSFGMLFSSFTTKYRDLRILLGFVMQLWMYLTPIIYPVSSLPEKYRWLIYANPMTSIVESFKYSFFGRGHFLWGSLLYSCVFMLILFFISLIIFNRIEKNFMDTV